MANGQSPKFRLVQRLNCCGIKRYFVVCDFVKEDGSLETDCIVFAEPSLAYRWLIQPPRQIHSRRQISIEEQCTQHINYRSATLRRLRIAQQGRDCGPAPAPPRAEGARESNASEETRP